MTFRLTLTDITEKKKILDELRESEKRFRLLSDASPAIIWMLDDKNNLIYLNKRGLSFYGKTLQELKGDAWFKMTHPDDRKNFEARFSNAIKEKKTFEIETRRKNSDDEYRWIYYSAAPRFLINNEFEGYVGIGIDLTEKNELRMELENSLKEKEILLKEIHHRVKNNLQIISSILSLQAHYLNNNSMEDILKGCRLRVLSLSLLHEQLYHSKDLININFEEYIRALIDNLSTTYLNGTTDISFDLDFGNISPDLETSINLGLIINELVSNSLKHAFKGEKKGKISVSLKYTGNSEKMELKVSDNGIGLPDDFNARKSLGFELVLSLVEQIKGELEIIKNGKTEFQILF